MNSYFSLLFSLFLGFILNAQQLTSPNLQNLEALCRTHSRNPDSLLVYANKLLDAATTGQDLRGQISGHVFMANALGRKRDFQNSNSHLYRANSLSAQAQLDTYKNQIYYNLANNHKNIKYYDSAQFYYSKLLKFHESNHNAFEINNLYFQLGTTYFMESKLDSAKIYLNKAVAGFSDENLRHPNREQFLGNAYYFLGQTHYLNKVYNQALEDALKSQNIAEKIHFKPAYARNYNLIARCYEQLKQADKATEYYELEDQNTVQQPKDAVELLVSQKHNELAAQEGKKKISRLSKDKVFYKTNFFRALIIAIILSVVAFIFYRRYRTQKKEVLELQEELNVFKEESSKTPAVPESLIHLKSKAVVNSNDILYIKSDRIYIEIYTTKKDKPEIERQTLSNFLETLPETNFVRTHKSFVVNIQKIKIINSTQLMLEDGTWIKLSRTYKDALKKILHKS